MRKFLQKLSDRLHDGMVSRYPLGPVKTAAVLVFVGIVVLSVLGAIASLILSQLKIALIVIIIGLFSVNGLANILRG